MPNQRSARQATARDLRIIQHPWLWPEWPWLTVVRQTHVPGLLQHGVMYDARGISGVYGYTCTVFLADARNLPQTEAAFFAMPRCVYDTYDELADAGWIVAPSQGAEF